MCALFHMHRATIKFFMDCNDFMNQNLIHRQQDDTKIDFILACVKMNPCVVYITVYLRVYAHAGMCLCVLSLFPHLCP